MTEHIERRSCGRKKRFDTEEDALSYGRILKPTAPKVGWPKIIGMDMHAYKCHFCDKWHVGHKNE